MIDLQGSRSPQCDVLVINSDQPIGLAGDDADRGTFIVEGVSAVGEIKSQLTASTLRDAINKGEKLKQLRVTEQAGTKYFGTMADAKRFGVTPPYFLFAFESAIAENTLVEMLTRVPRVGPADASSWRGDALVEVPAIDAVFAFDSELSLINTWDNEGQLRQTSPTPFEWAWMRNATPLTAFLLWIYASMPRVTRRHPPAYAYLQQLRGSSMEDQAIDPGAGSRA